jgi:hypothetical protein
MADPSPLDARPRLVRSSAESGEVRAGGRPAHRGLMWVLAGLLAFAVAAAAVQSERLDRMSERADELAARSEALQAELASALEQIRTFEAQREQVRESVADLAERVAALYEVVHPGGAPALARPAERAEPAEAAPPIEPAEPAH